MSYPKEKEGLYSCQVCRSSLSSFKCISSQLKSFIQIAVAKALVSLSQVLFPSCWSLGTCWGEWFGDIPSSNPDNYKTIVASGRSWAGISPASNVVWGYLVGNQEKKSLAFNSYVLLYLNKVRFSWLKKLWKSNWTLNLG